MDIRLTVPVSFFIMQSQVPGLETVHTDENQALRRSRCIPYPEEEEEEEESLILGTEALTKVFRLFNHFQKELLGFKVIAQDQQFL